jgi:predicted ATPase
MIKSLKAVGLNRFPPIDLQFHEDINVITGKNGSGKTTVLKLLWYAISGNLERIIPEIRLESFELETDRIFVRMQIEGSSNRRFITVSYRIGESKVETISESIERSMQWEILQEANRRIAFASGSSFFFPTFRRIEGGFSILTRPSDEAVHYVDSGIVRTATGVYFTSDTGGIQQAMNQLSDRVSVGAHRLVASISTDDISRLLTSKYAEISEKNNRLHMDLSRFILQQVSAGASSVAGTEPNNGQAQKTLEEIETQARHVTEQSESLLRPFTILSEHISRIFQYKGIRLAGPVTLGEARDAINSDLLSAGEKQMLSFLCYNAFSSGTCLFIDEPEISLHVDWQRLLFPILLKQSSSNQFIVATHSPFIYSKYADKELMLAVDRGDKDAHATDDGEGDHRLPGENEPADITG